MRAMNAQLIFPNDEFFVGRQDNKQQMAKQNEQMVE